MRLTLLNKKHFCDILVSIDRAPKSFNELEKALGSYPDTLNARIKEMVTHGLIESIIDATDGKNRIKHRLTPKGQRLMPDIRDFIERAEKLETEIMS